MKLPVNSTNPCTCKHGGNSQREDWHADDHSLMFTHPQPLQYIGNAARHFKQLPASWHNNNCSSHSALLLIDYFQLFARRNHALKWHSEKDVDNHSCSLWPL